MDVIPAIRATRHETPRLSGPSVQELKALPYSEYLQTPHWRKVRDAALRSVGYRCERCDKKRSLEVHHRTYERRGAELMTDLEVLCPDCHEIHHVKEKADINVFVALVSEALRRERFACMADLCEAVKVLCAQKEIHYQSDVVGRAAKLVDANRRGVVDAPKPQPRAATPITPGRPVAAAEAKEIMAGLPVLIRTMRGASSELTTLEAHARANHIRQQARE